MSEFERIYELVKSSILPMSEALFSVSVPLTFISFTLGVAIATICAIIQILRVPLLRQICEIYIWIIRGTPLLVQLFIVYFGLAHVGVALDVWGAAILAFSVNIGAYAAQSIRAAILSIPKSQWEAGICLGMTYPLILRRIILPQATRIALPPLSNTFISTLKDTSLVASITMVDMFMVAQRIAAREFDPLTLYLLAAFLYLMVCTFLTFLQARLEKKFSKFI